MANNIVAKKLPSDTNAMLRQLEEVINKQGETIWTFDGKSPELNIEAHIAKASDGTWEARVICKLGALKKSFKSLKDFYADVVLIKDVLHDRIDLDTGLYISGPLKGTFVRS
jgi:hypothetical protein